MRLRALRAGALSIGVAGALGGACTTLLGVDSVEYAKDAGAPPGDEPPTRDAAADEDGAPTYSVLEDPANWATYDLRRVDQFLKGFAGGAFDGQRYVYFAPAWGGTFIRYDTMSDFTSDQAWEACHLGAIVPGANAFFGAAFDGTFLYFPPYLGTMVARLDARVTGRCDAPGRWSTFSIVGGDGGSTFTGGVRAGTHIYFPPNRQSAALSLDLTGDFLDAGSWTTFDLTIKGKTQALCLGGASDDRWLFFAPNSTDPTVATFTRYDLNAPFTDANAWSMWTPPGSLARAFAGTVFDGHYVYLVAVSSDENLVRLDPQKSIEGTSAWDFFSAPAALFADAGGLVSFAGGTYDGRYVYLAPAPNWPPFVTRFDTRASSDAGASAWSVFDTGTLHPGAHGYFGAVFDGAYVYFVPNQDAVVARFRARSPPALPPGWGRSFF
jgi:hypothetical protein